MLKLILFLLLYLPLPAFAAGVFGVENPAKVFSATTPDKVFGVEGLSNACTSGTIIAESNTINAYDSLTANVWAQSFDPGENITLHSIQLNFHADSDACVCTVRIGTDLASPMEEWASVSINDAGEDKVFASVDHDSYSSGTDYYIGVVEVSGDCRWTYATSDDDSGAGQFYSVGTGWTLGAAVATRDRTYEVNKCQ